MINRFIRAEVNLSFYWISHRKRGIYMSASRNLVLNLKNIYRDESAIKNAFLDFKQIIKNLEEELSEIARATDHIFISFDSNRLEFTVVGHGSLILDLELTQINVWKEDVYNFKRVKIDEITAKGGSIKSRHYDITNTLDQFNLYLKEAFGELTNNI